MSRATDALDRLYSRLPRLDCQGMCQQSCGPINMGQAERARLTRRLGYVPRWPGVVAALTMAVLGADKALTCPLLDKGTGRCTVYAIRPMLCRLWGLVRTIAGTEAQEENPRQMKLVE